MKKCKYCNGTGIQKQPKKSANDKGTGMIFHFMGDEDKTVPCKKCFGKGFKG